MGNGLKSMGDRFEIWRAGIPEVGASFPATILRERLINGVSTVFINRKTRRIANRSRMQRPGLFDELSRIIPTKIRNREIERERKRDWPSQYGQPWYRIEESKITMSTWNGNSALSW